MDNELIEVKDAILKVTKDGMAELKGQLDNLKTAQTAMQVQLDTIDSKSQQRHVADGDSRNGLKALTDGLAEHKEAFERHGRISFEVPTLLPEGKSTILSTGLTSVEAAAGIQGAGRFPYRLRTLFRSVATDLPTIGVLRSNAETLNASPQVEGQPKSESTITFTLVQVPVQTLASFVTFSKQAMDDLPAFQEFINSTLIWDLERKGEQEILSGDGTGVHLSGLVTGATAFDTTILSTSDGWEKVDILGAAACQLKEAGYNADFAVVSPRDWFNMTTIRGTDGHYILGTPRTAMGERVYELTIVPSDRMSTGSFLVGDSSKAVIRQRQTTTVELSRSHSSNFTSNLVTALAETRFGLQVLRPDAMVTGSLVGSPA